MPKFIVAVDRTAEYEVEADSASEAIDIVFGDGVEGDDYKEVSGETTGHRVYDEDGTEIGTDDVLATLTIRLPVSPGEED